MSEGSFSTVAIRYLMAQTKAPEKANLGFYTGAAGLLYLAARHEPTIVCEDLVGIAEKLFVGRTLSSVGWFEGGAGIGYALGRMHEITGHQRFLEIGVQCLKANMAREVASTKAELAHGLAGSMIAYSYMARLSGDRQLTNFAVILVIKLLLLAKDVAGGVFWDTSNYQYMPLTGMAHGVSGVAYALKWADPNRESGAVLEILHRIRQYEDSVFLKGSANWVDLRDMSEEGRGIDTAPVLRTMSAWCHGRHGILLSRTFPYREDISAEAALAMRELCASDHSDSGSQSLCHGRAGNDLIKWRILDSMKRCPNKRTTQPAAFGPETLKDGLFLGATSGLVYADLVTSGNGGDDVLTPGYGRSGVDDVPRLLAELSNVEFSDDGSCEYFGDDGRPRDLELSLETIAKEANVSSGATFERYRKESKLLHKVLQYRPWKVAIRDAARSVGSGPLAISPFLQITASDDELTLRCTSFGDKGISRFRLEARLYRKLLENLPCNAINLAEALLGLFPEGTTRQNGDYLVAKLISLGVIIPKKLARKATASHQMIINHYSRMFREGDQSDARM